MPAYTVYEDVCSVDEVQTLSRTCSKSTPILSSRMSSSKSMMMLTNSNYNQQYNNTNINNNGKIMSSTKQNTKATLGYVDLNVNPHLLTHGPNKENIDPRTGQVYPMSSSSLFNNANSKSNCTTPNTIRDPLKDITLSVLGQTSTPSLRIKKLTSSSSLQTPQKNKLRNASASTGSLNPLSPSTLYLR